MSTLPTLLETVRVRDGRAPLWYLHLRRLVASCRALGVPFPPAFTVPEGGADRVHRMEVGRHGVQVTEREPGATAPVALRVSAVRHPGYPHKTTHRAAFAEALEGARAAGADDALLLTPAGLVAEATIWCLYWWEGDTLAAPALGLGVLPGVSRMRIEELAGPVAERRVTAAELAGRSLFLSNAVRGIVEVAALDGRPVPVHPGTGRLRERFWP
ncbi:MAG: aminotransferase class IV [Gemmatimonadetes bacterium]|nr:aminotransferase class IV [Gemmatimonadota bacterium]